MVSLPKEIQDGIKQRLDDDEYIRTLKAWIRDEWIWTKTTDNLIFVGKAPKWVNMQKFRNIRDRYIRFVTVPGVTTSYYQNHYWILIYKPLLNRMRRNHHIAQAMQWIFSNLHDFNPTHKNLSKFIKE